VERIAIFAALRWECAPVLSHLHQVHRQRVGTFTLWRGVSGKRDVSLVKTGVGARRAGEAAQAMSAAGRFALFLSTGCAGGLASNMLPGDLAVATIVIGSASGPGFQPDREHCERACRIADGLALRVTAGPLLCSHEALTTAAAKRAAAAQCGAVAVEMEGAPIAACAAQAGIPFVSVRAILDSADTEWRHAAHFIDPQSGAARPLALAAYLTTHPGALPELLAMQRMTHAVQRSLQRFFGAWFAAPQLAE
jgi:adenosylhomocysteine nucleosidase